MIPYHSGVIPASFWQDLGIISTSFWDHSGMIPGGRIGRKGRLGQNWGRSGAELGRQGRNWDGIGVEFGGTVDTRSLHELFPKQCLHYGVLAEHKGLVGVHQLPAQK